MTPGPVGRRKGAAAIQPSFESKPNPWIQLTAALCGHALRFRGALPFAPEW